MDWILVAFLALLPEPELVPVRSLILGQNHVQALAEAAARTRASQYEEMYCLAGIVLPDGAFYVMGVVKPKQRAWLIPGASRVNRAACPPGAVGDIHTHPYNPYASPMDHHTWKGQTVVRVHLIVFMHTATRIVFQGFDYTEPTKPHLLTGTWLIVTPRKENAWSR